MGKRKISETRKGMDELDKALRGLEQIVTWQSKLIQGALKNLEAIRRESPELPERRAER